MTLTGNSRSSTGLPSARPASAATALTAWCGRSSTNASTPPRTRLQSRPDGAPLHRSGHNAFRMNAGSGGGPRRLFNSCVPAVLALLIAGCGSTSPGPTAAPTVKPTAAPQAPPPAEIVKQTLVAAGDVPGSSVGQPPTSGSELTLVTDGLVPTPCIKTNGITSGTRAAVGTDVSQPLSAAAKAVTEAVILEANAADTATDIGQATAGARACPAHDEGANGQFGDQSVTTSSVTVGAWTGTRTAALDTFSTGVKQVASYVYFLSFSGGLMVLQLGVAFANVAPAVLYQQQADALATKLAQRLGALS